MKTRLDSGDGQINLTGGMYNCGRRGKQLENPGIARKYSEQPGQERIGNGHGDGNVGTYRKNLRTKRRPPPAGDGLVEV